MTSLRENFGWYLFIAIVLFVIISKVTNCNGTGSSSINAPDSVFYYKNEANKATAYLKEALASWEASDQHWKDSIAKVYNSKTKFLKEILVIDQKGDADIEPTGPVERDFYPVYMTDCPPEVKNIRQRFSNEWYDATVQIGDSSYLHLKAQDRITVVWKQVNEGSIFHRKKYLQLDVSNENPDVTVTGLKTFRVNEKKPKQWSVGLQVGYGISGRKPSIYVGIGISKSIIRF